VKGAFKTQKMLNILLITSLFGILQGAVILALMLRRIRKMPVAAHLLCFILLECIVVMMLITAENVGWVVESQSLPDGQFLFLKYCHKYYFALC
jgi:hypothetical protein